MRKTVISIVLAVLGTTMLLGQNYNDHRGHNIDSLELAVARWDAASLQNASEKELENLSHDWWELMKGYKQINSVKNRYYAEKLLDLGQRLNLKTAIWDASKDIGEAYWAKEKYDSAAIYFGIALDALKSMEVVPDDQVEQGRTYSRTDIDNLQSSLYGALGNLYSVQDSTERALQYYNMALDIFNEHGWMTSSATCYYNMAETVLEKGDLKKANIYYTESLDCARSAGDSLWIAEALKGFGNLYLSQGKTWKALKCLKEADQYYSLHEDEELAARLETLDFLTQVLNLQKRNLVMWIIGIFASVVLAIVLILVWKKLRTTAKQNQETSEMLEETLEEIAPVYSRAVSEEQKKQDFKINDRELAILGYLSEGMTTPQMADKMCLSPETVKWYRKKLLLKFDATSSAEVVHKAIAIGIIK